MSNILVVNSTSAETRVALVEDGMMTEFHLERTREVDVVGNIYKGKVIRVLPGMQSAFVDIAQEKAGFLHISDFHDFDSDLANSENDEDWSPSSSSPRRKRDREKVDIQDVLKEGQEIVVQVIKEPIGNKGARLSGRISIPGRYSVFMPTVSHIGISRRIESERERRRLRKIVDRCRPDGAGFIVRTVSQGIENANLQRDMELLVNLWTDMLEKGNRVKAPYLLYEEPNVLLRAARDLLTSDIEKIVVDDETSYKEVRSFIEHYMPAFADKVELYDSPEPIFDAYGIEIEINRALKRRVDLPSGGHLVIDKTEALTAIDVNTGRFVGKTSSHEETVYKTNIEAAIEIVYQLRLRNIGGIIILDFIDMDEHKHRNAVYRVLEEELAKDKVPTNALAISEFGLVEMTRKRVRESLEQYLCGECDECDGRGFVKSKETVAYEVLREIKREAAVLPVPTLYIYAHSNVIEFIRYREQKMIKTIEKEYKKRLEFFVDPECHIEQFDVTHKKRKSSRGRKS